jgi:nucleolar MIF4G domain-containing protein 1
MRGPRAGKFGKKKKLPWTTRLPQALRDELELPDGVVSAPREGSGRLSRKEQRKQNRQLKKQSRVQHATRHAPEPPPPPPPPLAAPAPAAKRERPSTAGSKNDDLSKAPLSKAPKSAKRQHTPSSFELMLQERGLINKSGGAARDTLDDEIETLERKLGMRKGKGQKSMERLQKEMKKDGLGDLLEMSTASKSALSALDDFEAGDEEVDDGEEEEDEDEDQEMDDDADGTSGALAALDAFEAGDDDDVVDDDDDDGEDEDEEEFEDEDEGEGEEVVLPSRLPKGGEGAAAVKPASVARTSAATAPAAAAPAPKYVPPAARRAAESGAKYVPPAARRAVEVSADDSVSSATARQVRGLLNKLTEQTMPGISEELASLFGGGHGSVGGVGRVFARTMLGTCLSETQILAPLVLLNAALVRALSLRLGQQVLSAIVEATVIAFECAHTAAVASDDGQEHACCNAALLLGHLFNFGAVHAALLYELVARLVRGFSESELQVLIVLLRAIGPQLRADDPAALKQIILEVQSRAVPSGGNGDSVRGSFRTKPARPGVHRHAHGPQEQQAAREGAGRGGRSARPAAKVAQATREQRWATRATAVQGELG